MALFLARLMQVLGVAAASVEETRATDGSGSQLDYGMAWLALLLVNIAFVAEKDSLGRSLTWPECMSRLLQLAGVGAVAVGATSYLDKSLTPEISTIVSVSGVVLGFAGVLYEDRLKQAHVNEQLNQAAQRLLGGSEP
ncbi:MAG: hypothetical protein K0R66_1654 [Gammaproteobacteria bacterium]|jgi:hypothetical protein|nr:hypothetical protein [Gammaproteobacteria bacterium]